MSRASRLDEPGAFHHVYAHAADRALLFADDADRHAFIRTTALVMAAAATRCLAWALLDNHFHLVVESGAIALSETLRRINLRHALYLNRRHGRAGHVFRSRFGSRRIQADEHLVTAIRYVHLNPLAAGIVRDIDALASYPWTGHAELIGTVRPRLIDVDAVCDLLRGIAGIGVADLHGFLASGIDENGRVRRPSAGLIVPVRVARDESLAGTKSCDGRREFLDRVAADMTSRSAIRERLRAAGWDADRVIRAVCAAYGVRPADLAIGRRRRRHAAARAVAVHIVNAYVGDPLSDAARRTGVSVTSARVGREKGAAALQRLGVGTEAILEFLDRLERGEVARQEVAKT